MSDITEGDHITVRGHEYIVETIDRDVQNNRVIQHRLDAVGDAPPARLEPSDADGELVVVTYESITEEDVEVVSGGSDE